MTSRPSAGLSPPPLIPSRSSPATNQQFPTLRPPPTPNSSRDGRSRSTNALNGNQVLLKQEAINYDNFNDIMTQKINDPLYTDQLARLNRVTNAMSQHLATMNSYLAQFTILDSQQHALLKNVQEQKAILESESRTRLARANPFIAEQNKVMESIEKRVNKARAKLSEQTDMLGDINDRIVENRRMMSLPPPSSRNITSAPPLPSRSRQSSVDVSMSRQSSSGAEAEPPGWKCTIA